MPGLVRTIDHLENRGTASRGQGSTSRGCVAGAAFCAPSHGSRSHPFFCRPFANRCTCIGFLCLPVLQAGGATPTALYHRHNPFNLSVHPREGEELPGVQQLMESMDEMDEQR